MKLKKILSLSLVFIVFFNINVFAGDKKYGADYIITQYPTGYIYYGFRTDVGYTSKALEIIQGEYPEGNIWMYYAAKSSTSVYSYAFNINVPVFFVYLSDYKGFLNSSDLMKVVSTGHRRCSGEYGHSSSNGYGFTYGVESVSGILSYDLSTYTDAYCSVPYYAYGEMTLQEFIALYSSGKAVASEIGKNENILQYSSDVEIPQNFRMTFTEESLEQGRININSNEDYRNWFNDSDFLFLWNQTADVDLTNYKTEIYIEIDFAFRKWFYLIWSGEHTYPRTSLDTVETVFSNNYILYNQTVKERCRMIAGEGDSVDISIRDIRVWVRNIDEFNNTCSNWVYLNMGDFDSIRNGVVTGRYEEVPFDPENPDNADLPPLNDSESGYGSSYNPSGSSGLIDFIMSGFGMTGDSGLIAFFTDFFKFLPSEISTILISGVGIMVTIGIVKFIRG